MSGSTLSTRDKILHLLSKYNGAPRSIFSVFLWKSAPYWDEELDLLIEEGLVLEKRYNYMGQIITKYEVTKPLGKLKEL